MKKIAGRLSLICFSFVLFGQATAQKEIRNADGSYFKQCSHFAISKPLRDLPTVKKQKKESHEASDGRNRRPWQTPSTVPFSEDPIVQREQGVMANQNTIQNFDGQTSMSGFDPLDPNGMVGPNHYVQAVNSNYRVYSKTGAPLTGVIDLATLFPNSLDDGDPVVMYDKFADRWVITEFLCPGGGNCTKLLFAISTTNDPTGSYYLYTFEPDAADFADYPKYSIWADGYYETCNCTNQKVTVYERAKMLLGDTTAGFIVIPSISNPSGSGGFFCPQTLYADGQLPPYGSPQYMFCYTDNNWGPSFSDRIRIYKITANWTNKTGTLAPFDSLVPQPFNSYFTGGTEKDISQPGTTNKLDALDGFFSYRIPYIRWSNYNSAVMCHPVNVGSSTNRIAGIRWYELRQNTSTQAWSIYQQGTYAPADGVSRWNPAIAMDMNGGIGLAYSVSSSTLTYPGTRYTGRAQCDSLGVMTLAEGTGIAGSSSWTGDNRWGDYSHTSVDPSDGVTFWHTNQYIGPSQALNTRIFSFQVPSPCLTTGLNNLQGKAADLTAFQDGSQLMVKAGRLPSDSPVNVEIYDIEGRMIVGKTLTPVAGTLETSFNVAEFARALYYVRVINNAFQRTVKVPVQ